MLATVPSKRKQIKIMIVDDNAVFRALIRESLRSVSPDIRECCDGYEAVECCEEFKPDWITMDIEMRDMDGLTAASRIKSHHPGTCILIVSQHDIPEFREAAKEIGCSAFISKEDISQVRKMIRSITQNENQTSD